MTTVISGMMALKATSATTGRTKNQAFWLTVFLIVRASRHQPAVFVDLRVRRIEAEMRPARRDRRVPPAPAA